MGGASAKRARGGAKRTALVVLALWVDAAAARAEGPTAVAVLPVAGDRVSLADVSKLERLDRALVEAWSAERGVVVQDRAITDAHLASARDMGLACAVDDAACLGKLAILAEVHALVAPIAAVEKSGYDVTLLLVEAGATTPRARVRRAIPREPAAMRAQLSTLIGELRAAEPPPAAPVAPPVAEQQAAAAAAQADVASKQAGAPAEPARAPTTEAARAPTPPTRPDDDGGAMLWWGLGAGAVGLVAAAIVVGGAAALAIPPASGPAVVVIE